MATSFWCTTKAVNFYSVVINSTFKSAVISDTFEIELAQPTGFTCTRPAEPRNSTDSEGYPIAQKNKSTFKSMTNNSTFESAVNNYTAEVHCQYDMMM